MQVAFTRAATRVAVAIAVTFTLVAAMVVSSPTSARADSAYLCVGYAACADLGMSNHGYSSTKGKSYWRMYGGHNCTNYAAYLMIKAGRSTSRPWTGNGNANGWGHGMKSKTDKVPAVGAIAWWDANKGAGSAGHVAYVEAVISPTQIIVSEDNWGGDFDWRVITKTANGWPTGFIHFKDTGTAGTVPDWRAKPTSQTVWTDSSMRTLATTATMKPGTTAWVRLAYQNTGKASWSGFTLGTLEQTEGYESPIDYEWAANSRLAVQSPKVVAPGGTATFSFPIQIPDDAADGTVLTESFTPFRGTAALKLGKASIKVTADSRDRFTAQPVPTIAGTARKGETLTATVGSWKPGVVGLTYQWKRNGVTIAGQTTNKYTLTDADVGYRITFNVQARAKGYLPAAKLSTATVVVRSTFPNNVALGGQILPGGQLVSANGQYRVVQKTNGNLVVQNRFTSKIVWNNGAKGSGVIAKLKSNGTIGTYSTSNKLLWATKGTSGKGAVKAVMSSNGRFALVTAAGKTVWSTTVK